MATSSEQSTGAGESSPPLNLFSRPAGIHSDTKVEAVYNLLLARGPIGRSQVELYRWGMSHGCTSVLSRVRDLRKLGQGVAVYRRQGCGGKKQGTFLYALSEYRGPDEFTTWRCQTCQHRWSENGAQPHYCPSCGVPEVVAETWRLANPR